MDISLLYRRKAELEALQRSNESIICAAMGKVAPLHGESSTDGPPDGPIDRILWSDDGSAFAVESDREMALYVREGPAWRLALQRTDVSYCAVFAVSSRMPPRAASEGTPGRPGERFVLLNSPPMGSRSFTLQVVRDAHSRPTTITADFDAHLFSSTAMLATAKGDCIALHGGRSICIYVIRDGALLARYAHGCKVTAIFPLDRLLASREEAPPPSRASLHFIDETGSLWRLSSDAACEPGATAERLAMPFPTAGSIVDLSVQEDSSLHLLLAVPSNAGGTDAGPYTTSVRLEGLVLALGDSSEPPRHVETLSQPHTDLTMIVVCGSRVIAFSGDANEIVIFSRESLAVIARLAISFVPIAIVAPAGEGSLAAIQTADEEWKFIHVRAALPAGQLVPGEQAPEMAAL